MRKSIKEEDKAKKIDDLEWGGRVEEVQEGEEERGEW